MPLSFSLCRMSQRSFRNVPSLAAGQTRSTRVARKTPPLVAATTVRKRQALGLKCTAAPVAPTSLGLPKRVRLLFKGSVSTLRPQRRRVSAWAQQRLRRTGNGFVTPRSVGSAPRRRRRCSVRCNPAVQAYADGIGSGWLARSKPEIVMVRHAPLRGGHPAGRGSLSERVQDDGNDVVRTLARDLPGRHVFGMLPSW